MTYVCVLCADVTQETLRALVNFMYTGDLGVNRTNVYLLLAAAAQLQVTAAVDILKDFHRDSPDGAMDVDSFLTAEFLVR